MTSPRLEALRRFLDQDPTDTFTRYAIALEYASMGDSAEAIVKMNELLAVEPSYVPAYHQLGIILRQAHRSREALEILERGIEWAQNAGDRHAREEMQDLIEEIEDEGVV